MPFFTKERGSGFQGTMNHGEEQGNVSGKPVGDKGNLSKDYLCRLISGLTRDKSYYCFPGLGTGMSSKEKHTPCF